MAFINIEYLTNQGFILPQSSVDTVTARLTVLIANAEKDYLQNTIGYGLTAALYALETPYPDAVETFLNGNQVDGDEYYPGILPEIAAYIMANYYGTYSINVNNSGFSRPVADGEKQLSPSFIVADLISKVINARVNTFYWLLANNADFFAPWEGSYFSIFQRPSVW